MLMRTIYNLFDQLTFASKVSAYPKHYIQPPSFVAFLAHTTRPKTRRIARLRKEEAELEKNRQKTYATAPIILSKVTFNYKIF